MVSPNEVDVDLREKTPLSRNILHTRGAAHGYTGQRMNPKLLSPTEDCRWLVFKSPATKVPAGNLSYPAGIRDTAKSGMGRTGNHHLHHLVEFIRVNVGEPHRDAKGNSLLMPDGTVGAAIVVRGWENQPQGEGPQFVGIPKLSNREDTEESLVNIGEMQRKLSLWAEQNKEHRFFDLYHLLYDKDWLRLAHDHVAQNAGSVTAGCDGVNMQAFDENLEGNLQALKQELKAETFEPYPARRVWIPKSNNKVRPLGIPTIRDRIVQEAVRMILEPIWEADFRQYSFGFRPNRCTMDAIKCVTWNTQERKRFYWIIEGDISSYFD